MKKQKMMWKAVCVALLTACNTQKNAVSSNTTPSLENSLLWEISGNGIEKPSYLFGTIHRICKDEATLSDSLLKALNASEQVYFEVDMDNFVEMLGVIRLMKMKNDTTLADLLTKEEYEKMKKWFENRKGLLPFSVLETYKPLLAASTIMESGMECEGISMEQLIMAEAQTSRKRINGLETMAYQMSIFDSIPYRLQAEQLLKYIETDGKESDTDKEYDQLMKAYREQDLTKLSQLISGSDMGGDHFENILLNNRNRNWVKKLKGIMPDKPVMIAVGAGHLPGENGVINLLRKEGYTVKPVRYTNTKQVTI